MLTPQPVPIAYLRRSYATLIFSALGEANTRVRDYADGDEHGRSFLA